jgi:hypothetical protein
MTIGKEPREMPSQCTLPVAKRPLRVEELDQFFTSVRRSTRPHRTRLDLLIPRDTEAIGRGLAERESRCCSFFGFEFEPAGADVVMHIDVPPVHIEALDALEARMVAVIGHG